MGGSCDKKLWAVILGLSSYAEATMSNFEGCSCKERVSEDRQSYLRVETPDLAASRSPTAASPTSLNFYFNVQHQHLLHTTINQDELFYLHYQRFKNKICVLAVEKINGEPM